MKNKSIWMGGIIGFILGIVIIIIFIINSGIGGVLQISNIPFVIFILIFLTFIGYGIGYLVHVRGYTKLGIFSGAIFGFLSPWIVQFQFVNSICPSVGRTQPHHTLCVRDIYLSLFGTKASGGNWHLLFYIPLFMIVWAIIGGFVGFIIQKIMKKNE